MATNEAPSFQRYGLDLANVVAYNMLRNYWPVFIRKMRGAHPAAPQP